MFVDNYSHLDTGTETPDGEEETETGHSRYSKGTPVDQMLMAFLEGATKPACEECGSLLDGRRRNTQFCDDRCRMRYRRQVLRGGRG